MLVLSSTLLGSIISTPILITTSILSKLYSIVTGNYPMDVSRLSFIREIPKYIQSTNRRMQSRWVCDNKIHVLCRFSSVFSGFPPIVIIPGTASSSFQFAEFMDKFPNTHDVYCIDLPGWGISEDPPFDLATHPEHIVFAYYGEQIMKALRELYIDDGKYIFVGHSFGSYILLKSIRNGTIPRKSIHKCTLTCLPGLAPLTSKYPYLWGSYFIMGWFESIFKKSWSRHLFRAFLYRKSNPLDTLKTMHLFIPDGVGYKLVGRQMMFRGLLPPIWKNPIFDELTAMSSKNNIELIGGMQDTLVDIQQMYKVDFVRFYELKGGHSLFSDNSLHSQLVDIIDEFKPTSKKCRICGK